jgi:putative ABC transport system permease protein
MFKISIRGLFAHKARFVSTFLAVILGIGFLSGTLVLTDTIKGTFNDLFADVNKDTDAVVRSQEVLKGQGFGDRQRPRLDESLLDVVRAVDGVAAADPSVEANFVQIVGSDGKAIGDPAQGAPTFGRNWTVTPALNPFRIAEGHEPRSDNEVVIDRGAAKKGKLKVGDRITVIVTKTAPQQFELVGIATFGTADSPLGATTALFTLPAAQKYLGDSGKIDNIRAVAADGVSQQELVSRLQPVLPAAVEAITGNQAIKEDQNDVAEGIGQIGVIFSAFALVAVIVGGFVIYNTFSIITAQRTREMALLRAVGASRRQVLTSVAGEAVLVGVVGSIVGLGVGLVIAAGLKGLLKGFGFDIPASGLVLSSNTIVVGMIVGTMVTLVAGIFPAVKAARIPPVAALRDVAIEKPPTRRRLAVGVVFTTIGLVQILRAALASVSGVGVAVGVLCTLVGTLALGPWAAPSLGRLLGRPLVAVKGITGELARENAVRNPRRTTWSAAALLIGVGVVSLFTILLGSFKTSIDEQIDRSFTGDVTVTAGGGFGAGGLSPALEQDLNQQAEVEAAAPLRFGLVQRNGTSQQLVAINPATAAKVLDLEVTQGDLSALGGDGIAVYDKKANDEHWKLGDTITLHFVETGDHPFTIRSIFQRNDITGSLVVSTAAFDANLPRSLDAFIFVKFKPGVSFEQGRAAVEQVAKPFANAKIQDQQELKDTFAAQINQVFALMVVMLILAIVIALMGIANTLRLSVLERTRELGLLRAVGMSRAQVRSALRWESVIISVFGTLGGMLLGTFFGWAAIRALSGDQLLKFAPPVPLLVAILVLGAVAGVAAAFRPARKAAKLDILQAIATE